MFTKIFSMFFICATLITNIAHAAPVQPTKCFDTKSGYQNGTTGIIADYVIYFNNDESILPTINGQNCETVLKTALKNTFNGATDINSVLVFGSADNTSDYNRNIKLSKDRANTVTKLLSSIGVNTTCGSNSGETCANISIGDAIQRATGNRQSTPQTRAVYVFIIRNDDICDEYTIKTLTFLQKQSYTNSSIKQELTAAQNICDEQGKIIFLSEREKIAQAIYDAATALTANGQPLPADIPNDIKINILANGLVNIRNAMAGNTSVWKTADGKFNVARLASDSIAGVVLGTAGGLITSHVVKKNQISKGFDSVSCAIGGQTVASFDDEFTVGIQPR